MIRRRLTIGLLAASAVASITLATPTASANTPAPAMNASTSGDAMCIAIQPYVGYCVGNVLEALLRDLP
jgi:hypothetical protein